MIELVEKSQGVGEEIIVINTSNILNLLLKDNLVVMITT